MKLFITLNHSELIFANWSGDVAFVSISTDFQLMSALYLVTQKSFLNTTPFHQLNGFLGAFFCFTPHSNKSDGLYPFLLLRDKAFLLALLSNQSLFLNHQGFLSFKRYDKSNFPFASNVHSSFKISLNILLIVFLSPL
jgi:hypothetical protein